MLGLIANYIRNFGQTVTVFNNSVNAFGFGLKMLAADRMDVRKQDDSGYAEVRCLTPDGTNSNQAATVGYVSGLALNGGAVEVLYALGVAGPASTFSIPANPNQYVKAVRLISTVAGVGNTVQVSVGATVVCPAGALNANAIGNAIYQAATPIPAGGTVSIVYAGGGVLGTGAVIVEYGSYST